MSQSSELSREEILWKQVQESDGVSRAESYLELSKLEYNRQNYTEALAMCEIAKEGFEADIEHNHTAELIDTYEGFAYIYEATQECAKAEAALVEAIRIARVDESNVLGQLLRDLGRLFFEHKKWEKSIAAHLEASELIILENRSDLTLGIDYLNIGMAYERNKKYNDALHYELKAFNIFMESNASAEWVINARAEMSATYVGLQIPEKILEHAQAAQDWYETEEDFEKVWVSIYFKAIAYRLMGELDQALSLLDVARKVAKDHALNFHSCAVDIDKEIGEIYIVQGKVNKGYELVRRSRRVQEIINKQL